MLPPAPSRRVAATRRRGGVPSWWRRGSRRQTALGALGALGALLTVLLVGGLTVGLLPAAPPGAAAPAPDAPLRMSIDRLTPPTRPADSDLVVTGRVRNASSETWSNVRVYPFRGAEALGSSAALADAAATPAEDAVGNRVTADPWVIDELAPGETVRYRVRITPDQLDLDESGVYWVGVHALGTNSDGREAGADGRARTFVPLVPPDSAATDSPAQVALVLPVRHRVQFTAEGRVGRLGSWRRALAPGGRLDALLELGEAAGERPLSWLVDPAVLDALARIADGNPPRGLERTATDPEQDATPSPPEPVEVEDLPPAQQRLAHRAEQWLDEFRTLVEDQRVLSLPYADLDVAAAARRTPVQQQAGVDLHATARDLAERALEGLGVTATAVTAPPDGLLTPAAVRAGAELALADESLLTTPGATPAAARLGQHTVLTAGSGFAAGGPGPDPRYAPVALRQRFLAEAAVRALDGEDQPRLAVLPSTSWVPRDAEAFFAATDVAWLDLVPFTALTDTGTPADGGGSAPGAPTNGADGGPDPSSGLPALSADAFAYPAEARGAEVQRRLVQRASRTVGLAEVLRRVLPEDPRVADAVAAAGLSAVSHTARPRRDQAATAATRTAAWTTDRLRRVRVTGPESVTLSSEQGTFPVQVSNGLDAPVQVDLRITSDDDVRVRARRQVTLEPGETRTVRVRATTDTIGVHRVKLALSDGAGTPVGEPVTLSLRSAQVSGVIWVILGAALAVLVGAVAVRLVGRLRRRGPDE